MSFGYKYTVELR